MKNNALFIELKIIKEYWQIASIIATIIFFGVYFYLETKESNERLKELTQTNKELKDKISRLEGQIDVINSNMVLFVEKNPGLTSYRLELLEEQMDVQQLLNELEKRKDTEIKIIQMPVPVLAQSQTKIPSTSTKIEQKSDSELIIPVKKKGLFKRN